MTKIKSISGFLLTILLIFSSCQKAETEAEKAEKELREFVKMVEVKAEENSEELAEEWADFEEEFKEKSKEVKEESMNEINETWMKIKEKVDEVMDNEPSTPILALYTALGLESQNAPMGYIDQGNIVRKYKGFVNHIVENKSKYTTKDWEDVDEIWTSLNNRKNELEPLHVDSTAEIVKLKAKYLQTRVVNKTESAIEETLEK